MLDLMFECSSNLKLRKVIDEFAKKYIS